MKERIYNRNRILAMIMVCLIAITGRPVIADATSASEDPQSDVQAKKYESYTAKMTRYKKNGKAVSLNSLLPKKYRRVYVVPQGSATDGKYVYQIFERHFSHKCVILKYNPKTFKRVKVSKPLQLYHGNDMTYNAKTKRLYSANCDGRPMEISIVNPKTLKKTGSKKITLNTSVPLITDQIRNATQNSATDDVAPDIAGDDAGIKNGQTQGSAATQTTVSKAKIKVTKGIVSIAYNKEKNVYAVRVSKTCDIIILDAKFRPVKMIELSKMPNYRPQTIEADKEHIYIAADKVKTANEVMVYDWDGAFQYRIYLKNKYEIEGLIKTGNVYRATMYLGKWTKKGYKRWVYQYKVGIKKQV